MKSYFEFKNLKELFTSKNHVVPFFSQGFLCCSNFFLKEERPRKEVEHMILMTLSNIEPNCALKNGSIESYVYDAAMLA